MLLLLSTLLATFASCSGDGSADTQTSDASVDTMVETTAAVETEPSASTAISERFADKDYDGYTFRIMSPNPGEHFYHRSNAIENEIYFEEETGNGLYDAIYERNRLTEELLNIKIEPLFSGKTSETKDKARTMALADEDGYDLILNRLDYQLDLAAEKLLVNLLTVDDLDTTSPWWDENLVEKTTLFDNALFSLMGDINFYDDYGVQTLFFNKKMMTDFGYEHPYQAVRDGTWLLDDMYSMALSATADLNGDGELNTDDDRFGYIMHTGGIYNLVPTFGVNFSEINADGEIEIVYNEELINVIDKLYNMLTNNEKIYLSGTYGSVFIDSRKMFLAEMLGKLGQMREMTDDFGIVPMPKGDEKLDTYHACVSNGWVTSISIPITVADIDRSGIVLETLGAFSTDTVAKEFYNVLLTEKYIRDEESLEMLPIIVESGVYDWSLGPAWASQILSILYSLTTATANTYVSQMDAALPNIQIQLDAFMDSYR